MTETKNPHINCELTDDSSVTIDVSGSGKQMIVMLTTIIFNIAKMINNPTPIPIITNTNVLSMIPWTWFINTDKSDSAIVTKNPIIKQIISINNNLLVFNIDEPIWLPIGLIAISAPNVNNAIPIISITAAIPKVIRSLAFKWAIGVNDKIKTIMKIGNTASMDSLVAARSRLTNLTPHILIN